MFSLMKQTKKLPQINAFDFAATENERMIENIGKKEWEKENEEGQKGFFNGKEDIE